MKYQRTVAACYLGYVIQAIVNTFVPLLLLTFKQEFNVTTTELTLLITLNFIIQLLTDMLSPQFIDKIGYRASAVLAHSITVCGLGGLSIFPDLLQNTFLGLMICVFLYGIGGGLLEVIISPIIEALPLENKEKHMSILHSFYCWGQVAVVLISTLFFAIFGLSNWRIMALIWAGVAALNIILFAKCPILSLIKEGDKGDSIISLFKTPIFWIMVVMMVCSGASNNGVSQWLSTFMESELGISKSIGDIAGPCGFAALMGLSRVVYAKFSVKIELKKALIICCVGCSLAYMMIAFSNAPILNIAGCLLCGFSVGLLWPGTFSLASAAMQKGGTLLFAFLALAGDLGCSAGPALVGMVSDLGGNMKAGIMTGAVFPIIMLFCAVYLQRKKRKVF